MVVFCDGGLSREPGFAPLAPAGCRERGIAYRCTCSFLTDFDAEVKREVEVCAPSLARAPAFARDYAQSDAPAPVNDCVCSPTAPLRLCP